MKILWGMSASYCNLDVVLEQLQLDLHEYTFVCSDTLYEQSSRFYSSEEFLEILSKYTESHVLHTIGEVEKLTGYPFDVMVLAPCTANTLAKLVHGIYDNGLLMACKVALRNQIPIVVGFASNDALGIGMVNLGMGMRMKYLYFVPLVQDNYVDKPNSMVCDWELLSSTIDFALLHKQLQPVLRGKTL